MKFYCLDCKKEKSPKGLYCKFCGYKHRTRPKGLKYKIVVKNKSWFKKGEQRRKGVVSSLRKENPSYYAIHDWIECWYGKAVDGDCEILGCVNRNIEWSNKSGLYLRDRSDWQRLCKKHHHRYDWEKFGARKAFFGGGNPIYG